MMYRRAAALVLAVWLTGCGEAPSLSTYDAEIRWTSYGIPHVKAEDWASLGYGFAYATATDALCVIARDVITVNGSLSEHLGPADGNIASDVFHRAILTPEKLAAYDAVQSERAQQMNRGYVAGYNRYLRDHAEALPKRCADAPWVRPITEADLMRQAIGVGIRYGLGRFQQQIAQASPQDDATDLAAAQWTLPQGLGSNAVAVGKALSASGRGMLLGNPHYPWRGPSRFHLIHTTIPGEVDVMGTSLLNTNRVAIGFNQDIAWTHTVSTAMRFTLYQLTLNPENPYEYLYDGAYRPIEARRIKVAVRTPEGEVVKQTHTAHFTHFGPIVETPELPWNGQVAFALRDAVIDNYLTAETYDALNRATSTQEVAAAISKQGVYWVNTIAADRHGNAFYADISGTPNIDQALLTQCKIKNDQTPARLILLRGDSSDCEWHEDEASAVPGALPPGKMPRLTRTDYVTNSNDSYWLSNPEQPLTGYSPIIGSENSPRSLRTRAGLSQMAEMIQSDQKLVPEDLWQMLYSQRNYGAELLLDEVLDLCQDDEGTAAACNALSAWDRTMQADSQGGHVWREFWREAQSIPNLYATAFDPADAINTPSGINSADDAVRAAIKAALTTAQARLTEAGIALDAKVGDIQYTEINNKRIPVPGGEGWAGMFSMISAELQPGQGYTPIIHGNSYIQVISWDADGTLQPQGMLTYSQSPEPDAPHARDLTDLYAQGTWIDLPFTEAEIAADPNLRKLRLMEYAAEASGSTR